jgi:hypothetical protein
MAISKTAFVKSKCLTLALNFSMVSLFSSVLEATESKYFCQSTGCPVCSLLKLALIETKHFSRSLAFAIH